LLGLWHQKVIPIPIVNLKSPFIKLAYYYSLFLKILGNFVCAKALKPLNRTAVILVLLSFLISVSAFGQKEGTIWYFGKNAGVNFNSVTPVALEDSKMSTQEGCATIADAKGNLLFYTDGTSVWNKDHVIMPNGNNLKGNSSSTQSAVVVRKPASATTFIIFTVGLESTGDGLQYSEVDMSLNGGLGDVNNIKNVQLETSTCEKITAIQHENERDFWIITQLYGQTLDKFHIYSLTASGVNASPQVSNLGDKIYQNSTEAIGYLKGSGDGQRFAAANSVKGTIELFNFNNTSGQVSDLITLTGFTQNKCYGIEFSPNNNFLYIAEYSRPAKLWQYDLTSYNQTDVANSKTEIVQYTGFFGALQLAANNKIYIAKYNESSLAAIEKPNAKGTACSYVETAVDLKSGKCYYGLPTFYNSIIEPLSAISKLNMCQGSATQFELTSNINYDSVVWNFGDIASSSNSSRADSPSHVYTDTGMFDIRVVLHYPTLKDTLVDSVYIYRMPQIELGADTALCDGDTLTIRINEPNVNLVWQDGTTTRQYTIVTAGLYKLSFSNVGCQGSDSINVNFRKNPSVDLGQDTSLCQNDSFTITPILANSPSYRWETVNLPLLRTIKTPGTYWLMGINGECTFTDSIEVAYVDLPYLELGPDTNICQGDSVTYRINPAGNNIVWSTGSTDSTLTLFAAIKLGVSLSSATCVIKDSVNINILGPPTFDITNDSILCVGKITTLNAGSPYSSYLWGNGSTDSAYNVTTPGIYRVTATNKCGLLTQEVTVKEKDCNCYLDMADAFSPNNDNLNETFAPTYVSCQFTEYDFVIFNRWGEVVFSAKEGTKRWDGTYKGINSPNGVYAYGLSYVDQEGIRHTKKGTVNLVR
jgi:gliding motility-associated-like protein